MPLSTSVLLHLPRKKSIRKEFVLFYVRPVFQVLTVFLILINLRPAAAALWDWHTFTSAREMRKIFAEASSVWCATSGGVLRYDITAGAFAQYINTDGLAGNDIMAVVQDHRGRIWVAVDDGSMNVLDPSSGRWTTYRDYAGHVIHDLFPHGDSIFVSLDIGVSLYDASRWEVKETYKLGATLATLVRGREIWAAGESGVRQANLDFPNLMAPTAWTVYTTTNGLQDNLTTSICASEDLLIVGTKTGVSIFDGVSWLPGELADTEIRDVAIWNGQVIALAPNGVYARQGAGAWELVGGSAWGGTTLTVDRRGVIWIGTQKEGLLYFDPADPAWRTAVPDGPADNKFTGLAIDQNGVLWTTSSSAGVSRFDGSHWQNFNQNNHKTETNIFMDVAVDARNRVWAASWGYGIYIFTTRGDSISIDHIGHGNGLIGIDIDQNYVVVTRLKPDDRGNMWILNYQAANLQVVAVVDTLNNWQYFSTRDGIRSSLVTAIDIDYLGRKWIGTQDAGVTVLDDGGTPFDKSDDDLTQGLGTDDGLTDLNIRTVAYDRDGVMWIGTPEGLFYWFDGQVKPRYSLINDDINFVGVDVRNNKWIGTSGGLTLMDADGFTLRHFTTSNSPLVNDNITCFAFNDRTGETYIGTTYGLSRVETPYTRPAEDLSLLRGYPNPFILAESNSLFYIENLAVGASVRIFTPEGRLVRQIPAAQIYGARVNWDGRNDSGDLVASGIYLYLVTTESGLSRAGKVAVLRP